MRTSCRESTDPGLWEYVPIVQQQCRASTLVLIDTFVQRIRSHALRRSQIRVRFWSVVISSERRLSGSISARLMMA
jgi:hypothetical protein